MSILVSNSLARGLRRERAVDTRAADRKWLHWAWLPVGAGLGLSLLGIAAIGTTEPVLAQRQFGFLIVGMLAAAFVGAQQWRWMRRWAWLLFAVNLAFLVLLLIPFVPDSIVRPRNGARRWINLGALDFQPSELIKLTWVVAMAAWMRTTAHVKRFSGIIATMVVTLVPVGLIILQPDLDSALLFAPVLLVMLLAAGARVKYLLIIACIAVVLAPCSYPVLKKHQRDRIDTLIAQIVGDTRLNNGNGFQSSRAVTLAAAGGIVGSGKSESGALIHYNRLPEEHTDMIFAVIVCRWGLLGGLALWALAATYAFGAFMVGVRAGTMFGRLVAVGIGAMVFLQLMVNTGMTIGVLPVSGMTLPFVSYGGSSLVCLWITTSVLFAVASRRSRGFDLDA